MRTARLLATLPLLLAATPTEPLAPGLWEETLVYTLDSVNGSEEMGAHMQSTLPSPQPRRDCYSAADLADPRMMFLAGAEGSCRFDRFTMRDGRIDAAGECSDERGQTMHVAGTGHYSSTGYDFDFSGTGRTGKLDLAFRGRDSGRRIAACTAQQG